MTGNAQQWQLATTQNLFTCHSQCRRSLFFTLLIIAYFRRHTPPPYAATIDYRFDDAFTPHQSHGNGFDTIR